MHSPPQAELGNNKVPFVLAHGTLIACPLISVYHIATNQLTAIIFCNNQNYAVKFFNLTRLQSSDCRYNKQRAFDHEGWPVGAVVGVPPTPLTKKVAYSNMRYVPPKLTDLKYASQLQNVRHFLQRQYAPKLVNLK